jgi:hypothetical protein
MAGLHPIGTHRPRRAWALLPFNSAMPHGLVQSPAGTPAAPTSVPHQAAPLQAPSAVPSSPSGSSPSGSSPPGSSPSGSSPPGSSPSGSAQRLAAGPRLGATARPVARLATRLSHRLGTQLETLAAAPLTERLRASVVSLPAARLVLDDPVTVSLGVAEAGPGDKFVKVVERADRALYRAPKPGATGWRWNRRRRPPAPRAPAPPGGPESRDRRQRRRVGPQAVPGPVQRPRQARDSTLNADTASRRRRAWCCRLSAAAALSSTSAAFCWVFWSSVDTADSTSLTPRLCSVDA